MLGITHIPSVTQVNTEGCIHPPSEEEQATSVAAWLSVRDYGIMGIDALVVDLNGPEPAGNFSSALPAPLRCVGLWLIQHCQMMAYA